jgi:hypothetical protein
MNPARRYAETTKVPVEQSRNEVEKMLMRAGATRFFYGNEPGRATVGFFLDGRLIRMTLPFPNGDGDAQEQRRRWRSLGLIVKAKLEAVASEISTIEREFMADVVLPDGSNMSEWARPQLAIAFGEGRMPPLLPDYSSN